MERGYHQTDREELEMSSIEQTERRVESETERTEAKTERIEREVDECERRISQLEADIQAASSAGDRGAAAAMERSLAEQRAERQQLQAQAEREVQKLRELQARIRGVDSWNTELQEIVAKQRSYDIDPSDLEKRVTERARWTEEQWDRVIGLLQRLGRIRT
jgi:chromosome segregation ATPase